MRLTTLMCLACLAASPLTGGDPAHAAPPGATASEARERDGKKAYEAGRAAFKAGHYAEAARQFGRAYDVFGDKNILWNLGRSQDLAGELELARMHYDDLLGRADLDAGLKADAERARSEVERRLGARAAATTTAALVAALEAERAVADDEDNVELVARLDRELAPLRAELARSPPPPDPTRPRRSRVLDWVLVGSGAAVLTTGVVLWVVGDGKHGDLEDAQARADDEGHVDDLTRVEALALRDDGNTLKTVGTIVGAVGVAAATAGVVLLLVPEPAPAGRGRVDISGCPLPGGGGAVFLQGHW